jgi:hypothetical protein
MNARRVTFACLLAAAWATGAQAQTRRYPPLKDYLMPRDAEMALARTAAPAQVGSRATVKVLTASGYEVAAAGDNGFVCIVMRGWSVPTFTPESERLGVYDATIRAPICFDPVASRTVLPLQELKAKLGIEGKDPDAIARDVSLAYAQGRLPKMETVAFGYMLSAQQSLGGGSAWRPHMMVYAPHYTDAMLGNNEFAGSLPFVGADAGTPFTLVIIALDKSVAVGAPTATHRH